MGQWTKSYNTPDPLLLTSPEVFTECCVWFCIFRFLLSRYPGENACVLRESRGRCGCCRTTPAPISAELPTPLFHYKAESVGEMWGKLVRSSPTLTAPPRFQDMDPTIFSLQQIISGEGRCQKKKSDSNCTYHLYFNEESSSIMKKKKIHFNIQIISLVTELYFQVCLDSKHLYLKLTFLEYIFII